MFLLVRKSFQGYHLKAGQGRGQLSEGLTPGPTSAHSCSPGPTTNTLSVLVGQQAWIWLVWRASITDIKKLEDDFEKLLKSPFLFKNFSFLLLKIANKRTNKGTLQSDNVKYIFTFETLQFPVCFCFPI